MASTSRPFAARPLAARLSAAISTGVKNTPSPTQNTTVTYTIDSVDHNTGCERKAFSHPIQVRFR